ncbi:MAG: translation initiation factor IF-3 [Planctomycetaceae bacterium]|nr:translation initiation factor IF-3 [Planctomycetaceae bacterium]
MNTGKSLRKNEQIRISPIRLIDENDAQVGIVELGDAKDRARQAGLDLVEVAPGSRPPVCRIMDYGKWKYAQQKKERKGRSKRHEVELKEIRIRTPKIGDHDLLIKTQHARDFLSRGDRVQFTLRFRGRELAHIDEGYKVFTQIKTNLADVAKIEQDFHREGRRITMLMVPGGTAPPKAAPSESGGAGESDKPESPAPRPVPADVSTQPAPPT